MEQIYNTDGYTLIFENATGVSGNIHIPHKWAETANDWAFAFLTMIGHNATGTLYRDCDFTNPIAYPTGM